MSRHKPVLLRQAAEQDVDETIAYYSYAVGVDVALRFVDDLEAAFQHLSVHPATGSPRYATELDLPGLRAWPLGDFPQLVFYLEQTDHLDIWRILHGQRDIPAWLQGRD